MTNLRMREIFGNKSRKVAVVEAMHSRSGETSAGCYHYWSLEPAAVIVWEAAEPSAFDMEGNRTDLAELEQRFPELKLQL